LVAALAAEKLPCGDLQTFSIGFDEPTYDELPFAAIVAEHIGSRHQTQTLSLSTARDLLPEIYARLDEPNGDSSLLPTYLLSKFTRQHVKVALGGDGGDELFAGFHEPGMRAREPWVLEAVGLLNHPLRAAESLRYVEPGLRLLPELQRTGDIFFPKRWMEAVLSGHNTHEAADIVRTFLADHPHYPDRLRRVILQAADPLFRVVTPA
jgi:asparagine synthetase B (glutamine-hydrolysing)